MDRTRDKLTFDVKKKGPSLHEALRCDPDTPESLSHTKVRRATFDNVELKKPHWNKLVRVGHEVAINKLGSYDALQRVTIANVVQVSMKKTALVT